MNRILIVSDKENDLSSLIRRSCPGSLFCSFDDAADADWESFDAAAILCGSKEEPYPLRPPVRCRLERFMAGGKTVFCEFLASVEDVFVGKQLNGITHQRLIYRDDGGTIPGLTPGDVLDGHYNDCTDYTFRDPGVKPILAYHEYINAHDRVDPKDPRYEKGFPALWMLNDSTMICGFRLCNFRKARFAPLESWKCVLRYVVSFLAGEDTDCDFLPPVCSHKSVSAYSDGALEDTVRAGLKWFEQGEILIDGGKGGATEGYRNHIRAKDGYQQPADYVRTDCCSEVSGAYMMHWLATGSEESKARFEALEDYCYTYMQVKDGPHRGMMRWTETAWRSCYNDDTARVILPTLLLQNFSENGSRHFSDAVDALQYLLDTTCPNGLRYPVTVCKNLTDEGIRRMRESINTHETKAHHNAFHLAMFLLAWRRGAPDAFREAGIRGLTTLMELFPYNAWETSETEELCRLVMPLAVLYQTTGEEKHKAWLYDITHRLEALHHPSGGYREWDSDYHADCSRRQNGECALLAENGDPVADLLYSNNWLPLGFAYAYHVTKDPMFRQKWEDSARFFINSQIQSEDKLLCGAWARAFDLDRGEIYGVPHDIGWGPCCIESGWTVGEILMGLQFMAVAEGKNG